MEQTPPAADNTSVTDTAFKSLEAAVFASWPTGKHLPTDADTRTVFEHSERLVHTNPVQNTQNRRNEFRTYLAKRVEVLLGNEVAQSVYHQLESNHTIPTAQHSTFLSPYTLNPSLVMSMAYANSNNRDRENLIVLGCSGISFNNNWYPRGHLFHSATATSLIETQLNFFGRAMDADPVITTPSYNEQTKKAMLKTLLHYRSEKMIKKRELNKITEIMEKIYFSKEVLLQKNLIDQFTLLNFNAWKELFSTYSGKMPNFILLSQEKIAAEILKNYHMKQKTILHEFIFNKEWHKLIYKHFDGIMCAFAVEKNYGTFNFWYTPKNTTHRIQLFAREGVLTSLDATINIEMNPETISRLLENEELTPSTMLTFVVLSLYYGFTITGGLDQPNYLTQTKHAYCTMLRDLKMNDEISFVEPVVSNDIVITRPSVAFIDGPNGERSPASMLDLLVHNQPNSWQNIIDASKKVTLKEILYRVYPELYRDYYTHGHDPKLLAITEQAIEKYTGLNKKMPAWATLTSF